MTAVAVEKMAPPALPSKSAELSILRLEGQKQFGWQMYPRLEIHLSDPETLFVDLATQPR